MFAREHRQEYDPTSSPAIERPLANGRPLSTQVQGNAYGGKGLEGFRQDKVSEQGIALSQSPLKSPAKMRDFLETKDWPAKATSSPGKSSLSSKSRYAQAESFDPENSIWSDEEDSIAERQLPPGKSLHRHAKSVTFDAAPPQINEYEMTTPDPSSVASGSRDGSHDSTEDEDEESFDRGSSLDRDDSFNASLEDTEKTPVVLPEDWRFMSPAVANEDLAAKIDDPFELNTGSPSPNAAPLSDVSHRPSPSRTDSTASESERRPLPPLPASQSSPKASRERSESDARLSSTTAMERAAKTPRKDVSPPRPASISKAELQGMGGSTMPIEDRLKLMMHQDNDPLKTQAEEQRERRLRRASPVRNAHSEPDHHDAEANAANFDNELESDIDEYKMPPRISRDSILRKIQGRGRDTNAAVNPLSVLDSENKKTSSVDLDPDVPLPSTEMDTIEDSVRVKREGSSDSSEVDVYSIPDLYASHLQAESFLNAIEKLESIQQTQNEADQQDPDDESHYSDDSKIESAQGQSTHENVEDDGPPTPRANDFVQHEISRTQKGSHGMSLPQFAALLGEQDFGFGMESFLTPSPKSEESVKQAPSQTPLEDNTRGHEFEHTRDLNAHESRYTQPLDRPVTPEDQLEPPRFPADGSWMENGRGTPDSVIRHPQEQSPAPESPVVPEPDATIKSSGSKLKTRPSATPADIRTMAETRRQVSGEGPEAPSVPSRHTGRPSVVAEGVEPDCAADEAEATEDSNEQGLKQPKRKSSLVPLDLPVEGSNGLGVGIETEFDRVIEAQKVRSDFSFTT